ncbi:hypothetical protein G9A89_014795 [Geosiphon pyriformis]|nr:hypothetical protein G9A89_014795 [Geosiphon pyriformis]
MPEDWSHHKHDVLHGDNFSVLKDTTTQSTIFTIGSVIEDAIEKNHELWLVLQNMQKAYDSVGWDHLKNSLVRIKMCSKFIWFFGSIHGGRTNWVMTNFGLTSGYHVHDDLDQGEVFLPFLWQIFYDPFLCKVKRQESVYEYQGLKSKSGLPLDFPNDVLHHPSFYGLKTFEQIQAEHKVASVICFVNLVGILGRLFAHRSHDLQVLCWHPIHPLCVLAHIGVGVCDNYLADLVRIFHDYNL